MGGLGVFVGLGVTGGDTNCSPPLLEGLGREADRGRREGARGTDRGVSTPPPNPLPQGEGGKWQ